MTVVGSADVIIRAIGDKVQGDIQKTFEKANGTVVRQAGEDAGETFGEEFNERFSKESEGTFTPTVNFSKKAGEQAGGHFRDHFSASFNADEGFLWRIGLRTAESYGKLTGLRWRSGFAGAVSDLELDTLFPAPELPDFEFAEQEAALRRINEQMGKNVNTTKELIAARREDHAAAERNALLEAQYAKDFEANSKARTDFLDAVDKEEEKHYLNQIKRVEAFQKKGRDTIGAIVKPAIKLAILTPILSAIVAGLSNIVTGLFAFGSGMLAAASSSVALVGALSAVVGAVITTSFAFKGVGTAIKAGMDPTKAAQFAKAMQNLSPPAQAFVKQIVSMRDQFKELRASAGEQLFPKLTSAVKLLGEKFLPTLNDALRRTGSAIGSAGLSIAKNFSSDVFNENFASLSISNADAIRDLGSAAGDLGRALVALLDAASPVTSRFTTYIKTISESARASAEAGNESGTLTTRLLKAADVAAQLGDIFGNLFEGLHDFGVAAGPSGQALLDAFEKSTAGFAKFTDTAAGRKRLDEFFSSSNKNFLAISHLLGQLGLAFLRLGENPGLAKAAKALEGLIPSLEAALNAGTANIPALVAIVQNLLDIFAKISSSPGIKALLTFLGGLTKAIASVAATDFGGTVLGWVAALFALRAILTRVAAIFAGFIPKAALGSFLLGGKAGVLEGTAAGLSKVEKAAGGSRAGMAFYGASAEQAGKATGRLGTVLGKANAGLGRVGLSVGTLGLGLGAAALSSTKFGQETGLAATATGAAVGGMIASIAGIAGPWGLAAGAVVGYVGHVVSASKATKEAVAAALASGNPAQLSSQITALQSKIAGLRDSTRTTGIGDMFSDIGKFLSNPIDNTRFTLFGKDFIQKDIDKLNKELNKQMAKIKPIIDLDTRINFEQAMDDLQQFVASAARGKNGKISLDIGEQAGRDAVNSLRQAGAAVDAFSSGGKARLETFRKQIQGMRGDFGLSAAGANLVTSALTGAKVKLDGLTRGAKITISADERELLNSLGVSNKAINDLIKQASKPIKFNATFTGAEDLSKFKETLDGIPPETKINITTDTGVVTTTVADFEKVLAELQKAHKIPVDLDLAPAEQGVKDVARKAAGAKAEVAVTAPGAAAAAKQVASVGKAAKGVRGVKAPVTAPGATNAAKQVAGVGKAARGVKGAKAPVSAPGAAKAAKDVKGVSSAAKGVKGAKAATSAPGAAAAAKQVGAVGKATRSVKGVAAKVSAPGATQATSQVNKLKSAIAGLKGKTVEIKYKITTTGSAPKGTGSAQGGWVTGNGTETSDSNPYMLSVNEFVIRASAARRYGDLLSAINSGAPSAKIARLAAPGMNDRAFAGSGGSGGTVRSSSSGGGGGLRVISGTLSIDSNGQAYIRGIASEEAEQTAAYDELRKGM